MDKRILSRFPRRTVTDDIVRIADGNKKLRFIISAEKADIDGEEILIMYFFRVKSIKNGSRTAEVRTFFSRTDYISQKMDTDLVRWLTGSVDSMHGWSIYEYHYDHTTREYTYEPLTATRNRSEEKIIQEWFRDYANCSDAHPYWSALYRFQRKIKDERLKIKHKKETDEIDSLMDTVDPAPEGFISWVWETGMRFSQYLIYAPRKKNTARCECTCCRKVFDVSRKEITLRDCTEGTCPACGKNVTIRARGRMPGHITDHRNLAYIDRTERGFIFRVFHAVRIIDKPDDFLAYVHVKTGITEHIYEVFRSFLVFDSAYYPSFDDYEYTEFKQTGQIRWCHDKGRELRDYCGLYPDNLPDAWNHTPLKYSAFEIQAKKSPDKDIYWLSVIENFTYFPRIEWIIKMGLTELAEEIMERRNGRTDYSHYIDYKGKTIYDILGISKMYVRALQAVNGGQTELRILQHCEMYGIRISPEQLKDFADVFGVQVDLIRQLKRKSFHKLMKYITKESSAYPEPERSRSIRSWNGYRFVFFRVGPDENKRKNMAHDWLEYLRWCRELHYDLEDDFIYMPNNFKAVHDRVAGEYKALQDKKEAAARKRKDINAKKRMAMVRKEFESIMKNASYGANAFMLRSRKLILIVPESADDIRAEGKALHHCVATYVERVAKGETNIFFIRKSAEPEKPYYTMEWKDGKVVQCRGKRNCGMTPEVEAFTKAFQKLMEKKEASLAPAT